MRACQALRAQLPHSAAWTRAAIWQRLGASPRLECRSCAQNALVEDVEKKPLWLGIRWVPAATTREEAARAPANAIQSDGEASVAPVETAVSDAVEQPSAREAADASEAAMISSAGDSTVELQNRIGPEDNVRVLLEFAPADEVVDAALQVASRQELHRWWSDVMGRLRELELDAVQALLVLHSFVRMGVHDAALLSKLVDIIECRYFGMALGAVEHPALDLFLPMHQISELTSGNFQSLIAALPIEYKVKLILMDDFARPSGRFRPRPPKPEPDAQKKWRTMDPIEMELEERKQFEMGRIRVKRVRHVEAKVTRMRPGNRLRATLGMQLCQQLPYASLQTLAEMSQVCAFSKYRFLYGDALEDFQESLSRRIDSMNTHEVRPYLVAFTSAMREFRGSCALRTWRRKLLPAVMQVTRSPHVLEMLDRQRSVHPFLYGVQSEQCSEDGTGAEVQLLRVRGHRAAQLFISVATARAILLDTELFDGLVAPLQEIVQRWHAVGRTGGAKDLLIQASQLLLPLEVLADTLNACVACGVSSLGPGTFPEILAELFLAQFGPDIEEGRLQLSAYNISDVVVIAHAVALLCDGTEIAEKVLGLLWLVAAPKLKETENHLTFMLLNALVRSGPETLLTSQPLIEAVDKHLAQRLDYDAAALGRLGS